MSIMRRCARHTVRPRSGSAISGVLLVAVFAVISLAVYQLGLKSAERTSAARTFTSTARVLQKDVSDADPDGATQGAILPGPKEAESLITSAESIDRAVRQLGFAAEPRPNEDPQVAAKRIAQPVRKRLRVSAAETPTPGQMRILVTYTNQDADYAARLANALAKNYAKDRRTTWQQHTQAACDEARTASQHAHQEWLEAEARLDEFYEKHLEQGEAASETTEDPTQASGPSGPVPSAAPTTVENPAWIELSEQLAGLRRRREELLIDRTPAHPAVQENDIRIEAVQQRLAATERRIPGEPSDASGRTVEDSAAGPGPANVSDGQTTRPRAQWMREFRKLKEAATLAQQVYEEAVRVEHLASRRAQQPPQIEVQLARPIRVPGSHAVAMQWMWMALAAGVAAAAGVGMISAGTCAELPLTTVDQAKEAISVPVVGVVPASTSADEPQTRHTRRRLFRWTMLLGGLVLVAGCAWIVIQVLAG